MYHPGRRPQYACPPCVENIAAYTGFPLHKANKIFYAVLRSMLDALHQGETISIRGFGTFYIRHAKLSSNLDKYFGRPSRTKPKKRVYFRPAKGLKYAINPHDFLERPEPNSSGAAPEPDPGPGQPS